MVEPRSRGLSYRFAWLQTDSTISSGPSVRTSIPHWAEEAGEHMETDDRGHGGGTDPGCTCFGILTCVNLGVFADILDSFRRKSASWQSPRYPERPGARSGRWAWTNSWIYSSQATITRKTRMRMIRCLLGFFCFLRAYLSLYIPLFARFYGAEAISTVAKC